jgi:hypothetical protein
MEGPREGGRDLPITIELNRTTVWNGTRSYTDGRVQESHASDDARRGVRRRDGSCAVAIETRERWNLPPDDLHGRVGRRAAWRLPRAAGAERVADVRGRRELLVLRSARAHSRRGVVVGRSSSSAAVNQPLALTRAHFISQ